MTKPTAAELAESLADDIESRIEQVRTTAITETRQLLSEQLQDQFLVGIGRDEFGGTTPDEAILQILGEDGLADNPDLQAARVRFEKAGQVSDDFRAGLLLAALLAGDTTYEI